MENKMDYIINEFERYKIWEIWEDDFVNNVSILFTTKKD